MCIRDRYGVTKPIIDKNNLKESNKAKSELIPEAKGEFKNYDGKLVVVQKNKIYVTEAVSYTHLDVYKRQIQKRKEGKA